MAALLGGIALLTSVYTVGPDEEGVIRRFGKYQGSSRPGIHLKLPWPIESVKTPKVTEVKRVEIGFRTTDPGPPAEYEEHPEEALMLTGDENIAKVEWIVQYKIGNATDYLFNVRDIKETIRDASEAAMRQVIGDNGIDEALTTGKTLIQTQAKEKLQQILDSYHSGVQVVAVQLQDVYAPDEVADAFRDVASAKEDKVKLVNEAIGYKNDVIPKARGEAAQLVRDAEAYKAERVKRAEGDSDRFLRMLVQYKRAPDITRDRMYIEAMSQIYPKLEKIVIDERTEGILPHLSLDSQGGGQK
ncbi:FtsH protease activity modulator HflK [Candidatus Woesearchaeota archaeon]|nr:MAG: FtsH protease activity modulator HflK [Candidatus Woesearchaeota archaeon]